MSSPGNVDTCYSLNCNGWRKHCSLLPIRLGCHLCLSPDGSSRYRKSCRMGSNPRREGMHASVMRFPRSFFGFKKSWRQSSLRAVDPGHRLSMGSGPTYETSVSHSLGRTSSFCESLTIAHLPDLWNDVTEAIDPCDSRRKDRTRLLSGFSAGPECWRCRRMAPGLGRVARRSRLGTDKIHRLRPVLLDSRDFRIF